MSKNEVTGDSLVSKANNDAFRSGWDRIFKQNKETKECKKCTNCCKKDTVVSTDVCYNDASQHKE